MELADRLYHTGKNQLPEYETSQDISAMEECCFSRTPVRAEIRRRGSDVCRLRSRLHEEVAPTDKTGVA